MKKLLLLPVICFTVTVASHAQNEKGDLKTSSNTSSVSAKELERIPSAKNNWQFLLRQNVNYSNTGTYFEGEKTNRYRNLSVNAGANYFIIDGIAVGAELDIDLIKNVNVITKAENSTTNWMAYLDVRAQKQLSQGFNIYGQVAAGIGKSTDKQTYQGNSSSSSDDLFGVKVEVGAPISMYGNSYGAITPFVVYKHLRSKDGDFTDTDNGVQIGVQLEAYMGCRDMSCDMKHGFRNSKNMYRSGNSFIDFTTSGVTKFGTSTSKYTYQGTTSENKSNYNSTSIGAAYRYYVADNISVGAGTSISTASTTDKSSGNKYSFTSWQFTPTAGVNLPVSNGWNNLSLDAYYGFGSSKSTSTNGSTTNTQKQNFSNYGFNFCYNDFFGKKISLTPRLGYQWGYTTYKEEGEDDSKDCYHGVYFGLGVRKFFGHQ